MGKILHVCLGYRVKFYFIERKVKPLEKIVEAVYRITDEEANKIFKILKQKKLREYMSKMIYPIHAYCFDYYDVDDETLAEITKYGKLIPRPQDQAENTYRRS